MKPEEFFYSKQQLERYQYAVKLAESLQEYHRKGCLIFDGECSLVKGEIKIYRKFNDESWDIISIVDKEYSQAIVDIEYFDDGRPWVTTKKTIREALCKYTVVDRKDIKKVI